MATRGRKPKPTWMKVLDGDAIQRPNYQEPEPANPLGDPPEHLDQMQKKLWHETVREIPEGMLKSIDRSVFTTWVVACSQHELATRNINEFGMVIRHPITKTPIANPFVALQTKMANTILKCVSEIGFSPTSRPRIKIDKRSKRNPFADLKEFDDGSDD